MNTFAAAISAPFRDRLFWAKRSFSSQRGTYYEDLAERMENQPGTPIARFIELDAERYGHLPLGKLANHWLEAFSASGSFAESIRGTVPNEDVAILSIAEKAADLKIGLRNLAASIKTLDEIREALRVVFFALGIVALAVHFYVGLYGFKIVPTIEQAMPATVQISELGWSAILLHGMRVAVEKLWLPWLLLVAFGALWVYWAVPNYVGRARPWLDRHVLVFSLYREFQAQAFVTALSAATQRINGRVMTVQQAIEMMQEVATPWLLWHLNRIQQRMEENPQGTGENFATGLLNQETIYRMQDIAEYSDMSTMLSKVGERVLKRAPAEMEKRSRRIQFVSRAVMVTVVLVISWSFNFMSYEFQQAL